MSGKVVLWSKQFCIRISVPMFYMKLRNIQQGTLWGPRWDVGPCRTATGAWAAAARYTACTQHHHRQGVHCGAFQNCTATWSAFFAKLSHEGYRTLSGPQKAVQIDRFILPVLRSRWIGWPFGKGMAQKIDAFQNRLIAAVLNVHMLPEEDLPDYIRRRAHLACAFSTEQGAWSTRWAADIKNLNAHCRWNSFGAIWTSALLRLGTPT